MKRYLAEGVIKFNSDAFRVYLSNATPDAAANTIKADLAEIGATGRS